MQSQFSRTELLTGKEATEILKNSRVAVFGIGGVGSYAAEALARAGVGNLTLVDSDKVCITNINRQIIALNSTVGKFKTQVMKERISDINPAAVVTEKRVFFDASTLSEFDFTSYDYVIDAIDTVTSKLLIIKAAKAAGAKVLSCMGAGNKTGTAFIIDDIEKTSVCPLARVMRIELKKAGVKGVKALYSKELPKTPDKFLESICRKGSESADGSKAAGSKRRQIPGSMPYVPAIAGLTAAGEVIRDLTQINKRHEN